MYCTFSSFQHTAGGISPLCREGPGICQKSLSSCKRENGLRTALFRAAPSGLHRFSAGSDRALPFLHTMKCRINVIFGISLI